MILPSIRLTIAEDSTDPADDRHFLSVRHLKLVAHYPNGNVSEAFTYDILRRRALDAVVILAHHTLNGEVRVFLRSAVRPPIVFRGDPAPSPNLWEIPAGLVEPNEEPRAAAARELSEELGFSVPETALEELGPSAYPAPGFTGERQIFFHVRVDPKERQTPSEDGSPLEREAAIIEIPLSHALELARQGRLRDGKTELALRRLAEML